MEVRAELLHADGRTDGHDEANSLFSQFLPTRLKMEMKNMLIRPFSTKN